MKTKLLQSLFILSLITWNCESEPPQKSSRVVIGAAADVENLNPLYAFGLLEGTVRELMYAGLVSHRWDDKTGDLVSYPSLAEKWEWNKDSSSITFFLRDDIYWSDSVKITSDDIVFSFDLYSDPVISSTFYGGFENLFTDSEQRIILSKTFEMQSPDKIKINFKPGTTPSLFDIDMPILPKHVYSKIARENLNTANLENNVVTSGAYTLSNWKRNEAIFLKAVPNSFLFSADVIKELIFKIVPDENSRLTQLKKGEVDLIEDIGTEFISDLKSEKHIRVLTRTGRDYDYISWNNIDPVKFSKNKTINPHKLFGSVNVRKALSYAVNKEEILKEYLQGYGRLSFGPLSPIFTKYYNNELKPYEFNPAKAKELLASEGWIDHDHNGIVEKNNGEFAFKLFIGSGNPRRDYAATIVKNNLKAVGIDMQIESLEMGTFINKVFDRELDAFMAGWTIPIPLDLHPYWHSDFSKSPLNLSGFNHPEVDRILDVLEKEKSQSERILLYRKIQELLHENEPVTFLYWLDIVTAYNLRIDNVNINPLGAVQYCWEWRIRE